MKKFCSFLITVCLLIGVLNGIVGCAKEEKVGSRYEITAEYLPQNGTLAGTAKVTFQNNENEEISLLKFQLYPNAYRENALFSPIAKEKENTAYYSGKNYGNMVISSVNGAKNWEVLGEDENILYVFLPKPLYFGEQAVLDIAFMVKFAKVNHRTGITANTVNLGDFYPVLCGRDKGGFYECVSYPIGDSYYQDIASYSVKLKLPKEYTLATTGEILEEKTLERKKEYAVQATNARNFAMVISDKFREIKEEVNGKTVQYYYILDKNPKESLLSACESFAYFEENFGEYLYKNYTLVETGICESGFDYTGLCMISNDLSKEERTKAIALKTAHQWWGVAVGNNQVENAWQDDGLAQYSALCFFENYEKYGVARETAVQDALREYRSYYDVYGSVLGRTDTSMRKHLKDFINEYEYKCVAQHKAVVMLDTLRKSVGDKKFFTGLKRYYKENARLQALPESLSGAYERTGVDTYGFFESFLNGKAIL